jgi:hypothetical protein
MDSRPPGFFTPDDLHLLEVVYGLVLQRDSLSPDSPEAHVVARALIEAFQKGARNHATLLKAVELRATESMAVLSKD